MYLDQLDRLDQKILTLLIENARYSYSEIGERIGISRVAVKARIDALEKKGIIEEYTTIINPQKISGAVSCYFEIEAEPARLQEIEERLCRNETITQMCIRDRPMWWCTVNIISFSRASRPISLKPRATSAHSSSE